MIILNDNLNIEIFNPPKLKNDHEEEIESAVSEFIKDVLLIACNNLFEC